ncbi:MAG: elongation factor maturation arginine rhamnosyltransferase EarP [Pseudomonadota bacterium]|jgi:uncharacterized repeat protein (TIGR03837 family)
MKPDVKQPMLWDIFCQVIDNHGDLGVCWRLATQLVSRGQEVRLWVDDASALRWMAPQHLQLEKLHVHAWTQALTSASLSGLPLADVWIEAFGCSIPSEFIATFADQAHFSVTSSQRPVWINLEYLSAESYVERCHQLPSPVMAGTARGAVKYFFYPGFSTRTGGLLREHDFDAQQARFDRAAWLAAHDIPWQGEHLISLFCYEPFALTQWLTELATHPHRTTQVLVTHGRPQQAVAQALTQLQQASAGWGRLKLHQLPPLSQHDYDRLLWACDINFVRGEDSLVRAIWAGKPLVWHIYPQDDDAHWDKLYAFLTQMHIPCAWQAFHTHWNRGDDKHQKRENAAPPTAVSFCAAAENPHLAAHFAAMRQSLAQQTDLCQQLMDFVALKKYTPTDKHGA